MLFYCLSIAAFILLQLILKIAIKTDFYKKKVTLILTNLGK